MVVNSEKGNAGTSCDLELGVDGFHYSDLFDAVKLKELADVFYAEVTEAEPVLGSALSKYVAAEGRGYERKAESKILTDAAPFLSAFISRMFGIDSDRARSGKRYPAAEPDLEIQVFRAASGGEEVQGGRDRKAERERAVDGRHRTAKRGFRRNARLR